MCFKCTHFRPTVARIGFVDTSYTATERDGVVVVSVALLDGSLTDDVVVRLETADGSATGELTIMCTYIIVVVGAAIEIIRTAVSSLCIHYFLNYYEQ